MHRVRRWRQRLEQAEAGVREYQQVAQAAEERATRAEEAALQSVMHRVRRWRQRTGAGGGTGA